MKRIIITLSIVAAVLSACSKAYDPTQLDEEIAKRKAEMPLKKKQVSGYLKRYAAQVSSADKGAIINK